MKLMELKGFSLLLTLRCVQLLELESHLVYKSLMLCIYLTLNCVQLITNISGSTTPNATMATPEPSKSPSPLVSFSTDLPHAVAKFKFQAESAKELSFQKVCYIMCYSMSSSPPLHQGDILFLSKRVDDNWYKGYSGSGQMGIFPCSYVQVSMIYWGSLRQNEVEL